MTNRNELWIKQTSLIKSELKNMIGVSPEPYLDHISNPFNKRQWNYLSLGKTNFLEL